jgi:hypothetical protein
MCESRVIHGLTSTCPSKRNGIRLSYESQHGPANVDHCSWVWQPHARSAVRPAVKDYLDVRVLYETKLSKMLDSQAQNADEEPEIRIKDITH